MKVVLDNLIPITKAQLDGLAIEFNSTHHQKYRTSISKNNSTSGLTNLKNMGVSEWVGIFYLLVILAQTKVGWAIINGALRKGHN